MSTGTSSGEDNISTDISSEICSPIHSSNSNVRYCTLSNTNRWGMYSTMSISMLSFIYLTPASNNHDKNYYRRLVFLVSLYLVYSNNNDTDDADTDDDYDDGYKDKYRVLFHDDDYGDNGDDLNIDHDDIDNNHNGDYKDEDIRLVLGSICRVILSHAIRLLVRKEYVDCNDKYYAVIISVCLMTIIIMIIFIISVRPMKIIIMLGPMMIITTVIILGDL